MSRRPIDLPRVQRALAKLDEIARDHPEAFDPDRLPSTPEALAAAMRGPRPVGRPPSPDPAVQIPLRVPRSMLTVLDTLVAERQRTDPGITRPEVIREAIGRYLAAAKRKAKRGGE